MTTNSTNTDSIGLPQAPATPPQAAHEVIEQIRQHVDQSHNPHDQRTAERKPWVTKLTLLIADPLGKPRTLNVATHDISTGGFSFIYKQFVHVNTRIQVHFESLPGRPTVRGVVRSCVLVGGMHHRVGVQFDTTRPAKNPPQGQSSAKR